MKKDNRKRKVWYVIGGLLGLVLIGIIVIPNILFTDYAGLPTTGPYGVKQASSILVDGERLESFETDGSKREVPIYFYYPDVKDSEEMSFPLAIFSHGAFGYYESNTSTYMELASHGYVVISLDHPYHSFFTKDIAGKTITVNPKFIQDVMHVNEDNITEEEIIEMSHEWLDIRVADMNFVINSIKEASTTNEKPSDVWFFESEDVEQEIDNVLERIDIEKIGLMGHSLGGAASVTIGRTRDDIDAVINLDGTMLGEEFGYENGVYQFYEEAYPVPLLFISNESHHYDREMAGALYVNDVVLDNAVDSKYTYFVGSGHMNFTDLPLYSPILASMLGIGDVDAKECILTMNEIILEYFNCYLKDEGIVSIKECY